MSRGSSSPLASPNPNIELTLLRRLRQVNLCDIGSVEIRIEVDQEEPMEINQMSISDYARPNLEGSRSSIVHALVVVNNFELKRTLYRWCNKCANLMDLRTRIHMLIRQFS